MATAKRRLFDVYKAYIPGLEESDLDNTPLLWGRSKEYQCEGEFYETYEPDVEEAKKKYALSEAYAKLAVEVEALDKPD